MKLIGFILIIVSNFLILWSVTERFGHVSGKFFSGIFHKIIFCVSIFAIWQVSGKFLALVLIEMVILLWFLNKKERKKEINKLLFVDEVILTMQSGVSLEGSLRKISSERKEFFKFVQLAELATPKEVPPGDFSFVKMLSFCRKNNSLSFKVLKFYREIEKLREKLLSKEKNISLQAKAQAVISGFLYFGIFLAQLSWNPDFSKVITTAGGKIVVLFSFIFLLAGLWLVFKISRTKELEL